MAICILLRHGRTEANATGLLAGWTSGIGLDETGRNQAARVAERLRDTGIVRVVTSPLQRCRETSAEVLHAIPGLVAEVEDRLGEARYGAWTGRPLRELAEEPLWRQVQDEPSSVTFPEHADFEHESMSGMASRAVAAIRDWDARVESEHGPGAIWVAVSHGDVIKAILANAVATPLDDFQRIVVDPASVSIVHHTPQRPFLLRSNDTGSDPIDLSGLVQRIATTPLGDADVGGGAGSVGARS
ncbi:MSMEG_4193 family putative phosphomutase [Ornithinimicrobium sp. Y1847]|uniref:MSMEG_4193 family putative phosphomutase n=1 Tax=unclassified Ornithinimicrobium TaxID=2615080 RepID=UPI003B685939